MTDGDGSLESGQAIGDYVLDEQLDLGPFSETWSAYHQDDVDREEALGIVVATHPLYVQWMADQQTFALPVNHKNLLLANEIDVSQDPPHLVYDLIPGDTLAQLIANGLMFDQRGVLAIVRQITAGVAALHAAGEFHGALTPSTVMLAESGEVLVLDTETARITRDISLFVSRSPTAPPQLKTELLPYLAPEERAQPGRTDPRGDIYSIGMLYYTLLTHEPPPTDTPLGEDALTGQPIQVSSLILECTAPLDLRITDGAALLARLARLAQILPAADPDSGEVEEEEAEEVEEAFLDSDEYITSD